MTPFLGTGGKPPSQCDQLLAILSDGEWHTTQELLREVPCIVHSRTSELRKRGHLIENEIVGSGAAGSRYRLVSSEGVTPNHSPVEAREAIGRAGEVDAWVAPSVLNKFEAGAQAGTGTDGRTSASLPASTIAPAVLLVPPAAGAQLSITEVAA